MTNKVSQPKVTVSLSGGRTAVANNPQKLLFVGQMVAAGTATSGELQRSIPNDNSWDTLFGENSMLASMLRQARTLNQDSQFDAIGLDDASGTAATGTVAFSGTATAAGTLIVIIGSQQNHSISVGIAIGDDATDVGDALVLAITADTKLSASGVNTTGSVVITNDHDGTYGNTFGLGVTGTVAGITFTVTGFASGATDPTLTNVFDVIGDDRYQGIVWPYAADTTVLRTLLDARFNVTNDIQDGVGFISATDTSANLQSTYGVLNSQSLTVIGDKTTTESFYKGPSIIEIPVVKASEFASIRALRLTDGSAIGDFVIAAGGALDAIGGSALASKPYFNTPFSLIPVSEQGRGWTATDVTDLFTDGVAVMGNNSAGNQVITGEIVTTYKTDSAGNPDLSFKYLNYVDTSSNVREYFFNNLKARFAQFRLTDGDLIAGRSIANANSIFAAIVEFYVTLSGPDFVLTQAGEAAKQQFISNTTVTVDVATGTATIAMNNVPLVTQLRDINAAIVISFSVTG